MQTALHIYSLVRELSDKLVGAKFIGAEFYRKEREAYLLFKGGNGSTKGVNALGVVYHPVSHGCFLIPRSKVQLKTNEKPWPFFQDLHESETIGIEQIGLDRIFKISLEIDNTRYTIVIEALGPNANIWALDYENKIIATLRKRDYDSIAPYTPPPPLDRINLFEIESARLVSLFGGSDQQIDNVIKKNIAGLDNFLIDELLYRAKIEYDTLANQLTKTEVQSLTDELIELAGQFNEYDRGCFYNISQGNIAYPFKLRYLDEEIIKCKTLSFAIYSAIRAKRVERKEVDKTKQIRETLKRHCKKIERKIGKIESDLLTARDYDNYKKYAELLQINLHALKKGVEVIELDDIYSSDNSKIKIKLDPAISPAENAEKYFKKFRKGRDALKLLERRLLVAQGELETAKTMRDEFEAHFENAYAKYEAEIDEILPKAGRSGGRGGKAPTVRLPYREHILQTGVTIFIGRDGSDNDVTTFRHAKPYELWFHASQCPGSHVVMKFPSKKFEPSMSEIKETASYAAYHSKARKSAHVPVIYTQRKYVRKPRNAKPGLVTVEREKSIMVEPTKPE